MGFIEAVQAKIAGHFAVGSKRQRAWTEQQRKAQAVPHGTCPHFRLDWREVPDPQFPDRSFWRAARVHENHKHICVSDRIMLQTLGGPDGNNDWHTRPGRRRAAPASLLTHRVVRSHIPRNCLARTGSGSACRRTAVIGFTRCASHGGVSSRPAPHTDRRVALSDQDMPLLVPAKRLALAAREKAAA